MGRLALAKGEGEGEGFMPNNKDDFEKPLTSILSPSARREADRDA
jgi:hypothetical protein